MSIRPLIAGNWKMNLATADAVSLTGRLAEHMNTPRNYDMLVCPPHVLIGKVAETAGKGSLMVGGQDCHANVSGAHTGDVAAEMLKDQGCGAVIVGHSERRTDHGESDATVKAKAEAALRAGLTAIVCVGETESERDEGIEQKIVGGQVAGSLPDGATSENTVIAYEPVWAIGTGKTPTVDDVRVMHDFIRNQLTDLMSDGAKVRILYGGSVKPGNAAELLGVEHVNGALVGGASLKAEDFIGIAEAS